MADGPWVVYIISVIMAQCGQTCCRCKLVGSSIASTSTTRSVAREKRMQHMRAAYLQYTAGSHSIQQSQRELLARLASKERIQKERKGGLEIERSANGAIQERAKYRVFRLLRNPSMLYSLGQRDAGCGTGPSAKYYHAARYLAV